ncbi:MAG: PIN domain-containing protein [Treponema sp.]|nr:PIN domain-containing protein [Treponema sp.]
MVCADANVLVRFIMKDNLEQALAARTSVLSGALFVPTEVFAEVVYVLTKVYKIGCGARSHATGTALRSLRQAQWPGDR